MDTRADPATEARVVSLLTLTVLLAPLRDHFCTASGPLLDAPCPEDNKEAPTGGGAAHLDSPPLVDASIMKDFCRSGLWCSLAAAVSAHICRDASIISRHTYTMGAGPGGGECRGVWAAPIFFVLDMGRRAAGRQAGRIMGLCVRQDRGSGEARKSGCGYSKRSLSHWHSGMGHTSSHALGFVRGNSPGSGARAGPNWRGLLHRGVASKTRAGAARTFSCGAMMDRFTYSGRTTKSMNPISIFALENGLSVVITVSGSPSSRSDAACGRGPRRLQRAVPAAALTAAAPAGMPRVTD